MYLQCKDVQMWGMVDTLNKLVAADALLLVIDLQEKLLPAMHESDACLAGAMKLIGAAKVLGVPTLVTEQYPQGLGHTVAPAREALGDAPCFEKMLFSACIPAVREAIATLGSRQVIITGIEAHVCVQLTVLDLLREGKQVFVCVDAISSRRTLDRNVALDRMRQAGAVITTVESVVFELLGQAGGDKFKQILKIVK